MKIAAPWAYSVFGRRRRKYLICAALVSTLICSQAVAASMWQLRADGYGPLRYGMSKAQVSQLVGPLKREESNCDLSWSARRPEIWIVFERDRLVALSDRYENDLRTVDGLHKGLPSADLERVYGDRIVRSKDHYGPEDDPTYWIADIYGGKYAWQYYVEAGKITHIGTSYFYAIGACAD